jgi:quercetin dioxygenase-like cupin family protein
MSRLPGLVIPFDELDHGSEAHDFVGEEHGNVPFSVIFVHTKPGGGPAVHRHPYPEVFIVEAGEATFQLGDERALVSAGNVVVGPSDVPHGFTNSGAGELRLVAIHGYPRFITEWLAKHDGTWVSKPRR